MKRLEFHRDVVGELFDIEDYYPAIRPELMERFRQSLHHQYERIRQFPAMGGRIWKSWSVMLVSEFPYKIVYRLVAPDRIFVVTILHVRRNDSSWKNRVVS